MKKIISGIVAFMLVVSTTLTAFASVPKTRWSAKLTELQSMSWLSSRKTESKSLQSTTQEISTLF